MLKKSDLNETSKYKRWGGFVNICYVSGWADNVRQENKIWKFDLRQTPFKDHKITVIMNEDDYLPAYFKDHEVPPVKLICRIQQDIDKEYNSLVLRPIHIDEPSIIEMPTPDSFLSFSSNEKSDNSAKTFNPYLTFKDLTNLSSSKIESATKKFVNNAEITGIVLEKTHENNNCFSFIVQTGENRIINARYYGKTTNTYFGALKILSPVVLKGEIHARFYDKSKDQLEVYFKTKNISNIVKPGLNFPKTIPSWYQTLHDNIKDEKYNKLESLTIKEDYTEPLIEE